MIRLRRRDAAAVELRMAEPLRGKIADFSTRFLQRRGKARDKLANVTL
jgi:hypothetical protein